MESFDNVSMSALVIAGGILAIDFLNIPLPTTVSNTLSNKMLQVVLGVSIVVAAYYHLPTAIILSAVLYVSLNLNPTNLSDQPTDTGAVLENGSHTVLDLNTDDVNNTGVPGVFSDPSLEPVDNPLPTQDNTFNNSSLKESTTEHENKTKTDTQNVENLENISGYIGTDMAPSL
ncbi:hypothetical protein crov315 [Cafeteria roenbergensis virus]|uniref:Uncharacterized protein n=1 Tax=Cafeteria roenbergensis virus (strain BV-PW1) TaxID=693272 RepID=E3T586_CROVB|nr:hypothetical protein crov315 [Cafeteria roenbergensis virus BV-PW1]ADO67349.1 hypothetical protein crov315 [Cafeteria roenbergensis virus BV-PW1]